MIDKNPYRTLHARMSPPGAAWDKGFAAGRAAATPDPPDAESLARMFHDSYEALAPSFGYITREASAVAWENVPADNKALMISTARAVLRKLSLRPASPDERLRQRLAGLDTVEVQESALDDPETFVRKADLDAALAEAPGSPDERLREALRDANEYLAQIADYSPSEVADAIDSVRAQIKDALAATDSRGKPDGASVPDQSCATCGGSGDRNGNRRAADPFGTRPGCGGTGNVAAADQNNLDGER